MNQKVRNAIYAVASAVGLVLTVTGVITQIESEEALSLVERALDLSESVILWVSAALAWWKSRESRVTTIEIPKREIASINKVDGHSVRV